MKTTLRLPIALGLASFVLLTNVSAFADETISVAAPVEMVSPIVDMPVTPSAVSFANSDLAKASVVAPVNTSSIVPGYYRDDRSEIGGHELYIKAVGQTHYALIVWKAKFMSLYRIEEIDATTQAWVQLVQGEDNMLTTEKSSTATYAVSSIKSGKEVTLRVKMTEYAKTLGPNVYCTFEPVFKFKGNAKQWTQFSQLSSTQFEGIRARTASRNVVRTVDEGGRTIGRRATTAPPKDGLKKKLEVILQNAGSHDQWNIMANNLIIESLNGTAFVNKGAGGKSQVPTQFVYNGDFRGEEAFPGLLIVRQRELDASSASGFKLDRKISFFAVSIGSAIQVMAMPPAAKDCAYVRNELK